LDLARVRGALTTSATDVVQDAGDDQANPPAGTLSRSDAGSVATAAGAGWRSKGVVRIGSVLTAVMIGAGSSSLNGLASSGRHLTSEPAGSLCMPASVI
jgi:hypothetical protein